ncbi:MAG: CDP-2,3-bis-(O-geranylgeranyl)-sn-glycerol synthase [Archaeoglobi archaeon]|nr:CDP-2,3-bis-(O-geranylgeranyl)-sn-glycerol synthase [Candidatus Mnemosynella bozhongmuii]
MIEILLKSVWLMLPAYVPNPSAVLAGGGTPIDFGKRFSDGRRILGDGKTFRGLFFGTLSGMVAGVLENFLAPILGMPSFGDFPEFIIVIFSLSFGAMLGDIIKSFFKRRLGFERGAMFPIADQLDFVAGSLLLCYLLAPSWFSSSFTKEVIITVLLITPLLHLSVNFIGYKIGKKDVPW